MTYTAEIHVSHPELALSPTIAALPEATVRIEHRTVSESGAQLLFVRVGNASGEALERALAADETVADPQFVTASGEDRIYRVRKRTGLDVLPDTCEAAGCRPLSVYSAGEGWAARLHLYAREALIVFRRYCTEHGITYRIAELVHSEESPDVYGFGLTERQRETLRHAYENGYYDVPRRITQRGLATALGVSTSAISQRLRRATARLIASALEEEAVEESP